MGEWMGEWVGPWGLCCRRRERAVQQLHAKRNYKVHPRATLFNHTNKLHDAMYCIVVFSNTPGIKTVQIMKFQNCTDHEVPMGGFARYQTDQQRMEVAQGADADVC